MIHKGRYIGNYKTLGEVPGIRDAKPMISFIPSLAVDKALLVSP